jgi:hypothetical protein
MQITNRRAIIQGYIRTWLFTDVIALLPFDSIGLLLGASHWTTSTALLDAARVSLPPPPPPPPGLDAAVVKG